MPMKLIFKLYAWVWLLILFLYYLNWSEFSQPLDENLLIFLLFTIAVSFILGNILKSNPIQKHDYPKHNTNIIITLLIFGFIINFIYARYIPFLALINGSYSYVEFEGIPTLFPFLYTFSLFYFYCLIYYYFISKKRKYLKQSILLFLIFISFFSRSLLAFAILGSVLIKVIVDKKKKNDIHKFNLKNLFIIFFIIVIVCYLFGVLGNIRVGFSWNDCTYIERLGMFTNYPSWLPKQFMWIYAYLISPLSNLNYNIVQNNCSPNIISLIINFVPEFVSKRWFSNYIVSSETQTLLIRSYFNAQTAYVNFYYSFGILGCYLCYFVIAIIALLTDYIFHIKKIYNPVIIVIFGIFITMTFFYNVFYYTLTSLILIWAILYLFNISKKFKIKFKI